MTARRTLRIAWLGGAPLESGGAPGVARDLLDGLARYGHEIECFFPGSSRALPPSVARHENLTVFWGARGSRRNRWYNRSNLANFANGLITRSAGYLRIRRKVARRHRFRPYDVVFQNQSIESFGVPSSVLRTTPLVLSPQTEIASELRRLIAERHLSFRCQPRYVFALVATIWFVRVLVQRVMIRRASLIVCISTVFRDHIVSDYNFPLEKTVVITNPVRLNRVPAADRAPGNPPIVLVPTRISVRKGIDDVVNVARALLERGIDAHVRVVGGPSLWSDYTKLLDDLPTENAEYAGRVPHAEMPAEFERADVMLIASTFDPCPLSVLESLAAGVPVVATTEVGSIEALDGSIAAVLPPGDVDGMTSAIAAMVERLRERPGEMRALARAEAERRFSPDVVCEQISDALSGLLDQTAPASRPETAEPTRS